MNQISNIPPPFDALPAGATGRLKLEKGEALFRQGDPSSGMFFISCGAISLIRHTESGQKVVLFRADAGDTIAEPSIFSDQYHCDAVAIQPSSVHSFDRNAVLTRMSEDGAFAAALVKRLAGQVQTYRRRLELLAVRSAKDRVMAGLADGLLTGTVLDFAAELSLSSEAVYRALADLVRDGQAERLARGQYRLRKL